MSMAVICILGIVGTGVALGQLYRAYVWHMYLRSQRK